ncbi:hypothetical protein AAFN85_00355 [Mucilaginibacter sp. CAU 1740]|uniref:hypothetical protein n=1 Tax=Mucilaginibacter sp. CAU 1740 TaxID=3140365 RepID=UPI00325B3C0B
MKTYIISCFLLFTATYGFAQKSVVFKVKYKPSHTYHLIIKTDLDMEMDATGDEASLAEIRKSTKLPMTIAGHNIQNLDMVTENSRNDNSFPFTMTLPVTESVMTLNGQKMDTPHPLDGQTIYGIGSAEGKLHVDSVSGKNGDEKIRSLVTAMINNISSTIQFPDKPMKIGETFLQEMPVALPIPGFSNIKMNIKLVYKLLSVDNDIANFDIDQSMSMDLKTIQNGAEITVSGEGKGTGKLAYSIKNNYMSSMNSNMNFNFNLGMQGITFKAKSAGISSYVAEVKKR